MFAAGMYPPSGEQVPTINFLKEQRMGHERHESAIRAVPLPGPWRARRLNSADVPLVSD